MKDQENIDSQWSLGEGEGLTDESFRCRDALQVRTRVDVEAMRPFRVEIRSEVEQGQKPREPGSLRELWSGNEPR